MISKEERLEKFKNENPNFDWKGFKIVYKAKFPSLTSSEVAILRVSKKKGKDWLKINHKEIFEKLLPFL